MTHVRKLEERIVELEQKNRELTLLLESSLELQKDAGKESHTFSMSAIQTLILALDSKDPYTAGHSSRVAIYSLWIARRMGVDEKECRHFHRAALMHDIGKIGVPDRVLLKDESLNEEEFEIMISHTLIGARILSKIEPRERMIQASQVAKHHHERMDGTGYPDKLKGAEIPFFARIVAVADAFDAMTTFRPYANERSYMEGVHELIRCKGTHFDPEVVNAFALVMEDRNYLTNEQWHSITDLLDN
ncbi:HD-GYP domain-containing protein [Paenibacillus eucommiae]|uniref:Nucleotidyltransferase with HDIG domain n=1 Tax=Paenibacillus eucommiae TaxID=1355755 RepID=A0ABS4INW5_9BACL|nr:HD-GYP domain-containing protein [Paenibacillus eucommiae]MBP1989239.1 putative nucleotidyltransferase with HDIG domain [Paenibacillus eucommiae]